MHSSESLLRLNAKEATAHRMVLTFCSVALVAAFFIAVNYHTPYAIPWVVPPVAFYSFDLLVRVIRMRFKDAYIDAPDEHITFVSGTWHLSDSLQKLTKTSYLTVDPCTGCVRRLDSRTACAPTCFLRQPPVRIPSSLHLQCPALDHDIKRQLSSRRRNAISRSKLRRLVRCPQRVGSVGAVRGSNGAPTFRR